LFVYNKKQLNVIKRLDYFVKNLRLEVHITWVSRT